jgi:hypothetical protein
MLGNEGKNGGGAGRRTAMPVNACLFNDPVCSAFTYSIRMGNLVPRGTRTQNGRNILRFSRRRA